MSDFTFTIPTAERITPFLHEFDMGDVIVNECAVGAWLADMSWKPEATYRMSVRRIVETSWDDEGANDIAMLDDVHKREGLPPIQKEKKSMDEKQDTPQPGDRMLKWFAFEHLNEGRLRDVSAHFKGLADRIEFMIRPGPERTVALRKLLEAKDAAERATKYPGG